MTEDPVSNPRHQYKLIGGQFELYDLLGQGATGSVFKARDLRLERDVAVKILHSFLCSNEDSMLRFQREQVFCGSLQHSGIVKTYSAGVTDDGAPYLVMDLLTGVTLSEVVKHEKITGSRFFSLFLQIIESLEYLHSKGLVHRDLKPSNVFLCTREGVEHPVLIDFGLSRLVHENSVAAQKVTMTGALVGTSLYMSPEQCTGGKIDERTDIYSLACMMYECLTSKPPFTGDSSYEVMYKQLNESVSQLEQMKQFTPQLARLITKCLKKNPSERFASMSELKQSFVQCENAFEAKPRCAHDGVKRAALATSAILAIGAACSIGFQKKEVEPLAQVSAHTRDLKGKGFQSLRTALSSLNPLEGRTKGLELIRKWLADNKAGQTADVYLEVAQLFLAGGAYGEAVNYAEMAAQDGEGWVQGDAFACLAQSQLALGDNKATREFAQKALKAMKDDPESERQANVRVLIARSFVNENNFEAAYQELSKVPRDYFKKAGAEKSYSAMEFRSFLAQVLLKAGRFQEASKAIADCCAEEHVNADEAVAFGSLQGLFDAAQPYVGLKELQMIADAMSRATQSHERDEAMRNYNDVLFLRGNRAAAMQRSLTLISEEKQSHSRLEEFTTKLSLARMLRLDGKYRESIKFAEEVLNSPEHVPPQLLTGAIRVIAECIEMVEGPDKALEFMEKNESRVKEPEFRFMVVRQKGDIYFHRGRLNDALDTYREALRIPPDYPSFRSVKGDTLRAIGDVLMHQAKVEEALAIYREGAELCSKRRDDYFCLLGLYQRLINVESTFHLKNQSSKYTRKALMAIDLLEPALKCQSLQDLAYLTCVESERREMLSKARAALSFVHSPSERTVRALELDRCTMFAEKTGSISQVDRMIKEWQSIQHSDKFQEVSNLYLYGACLIPVPEKQKWWQYIENAEKVSAKTDPIRLMETLKNAACQAYFREYKDFGDALVSKIDNVAMHNSAELVQLCRLAALRKVALAMAKNYPAQAQELLTHLLNSGKNINDDFSTAETMRQMGQLLAARDARRAIDWFYKASLSYERLNSPELAAATLGDCEKLARQSNQTELLATLKAQSPQKAK